MQQYSETQQNSPSHAFNNILGVLTNLHKKKTHISHNLRTAELIIYSKTKISEEFFIHLVNNLHIGTLIVFSFVSFILYFVYLSLNSASYTYITRSMILEVIFKHFLWNVSNFLLIRVSAMSLYTEILLQFTFLKSFLSSNKFYKRNVSGA